MRKNFGSKPLSYSQPVLIICSYDKDGKANAMNAAWGGISEANEIAMCLDSSHKTVANILETGAFTVSMGDEKNVVACDYLGIASGNKVENKMEKAGFTVNKSEFVDAPIINELAVCLECKLIDYNIQSCILRGEIVNVSVDESALTDGKVDINKVRPITLDPFNSTYNLIGQAVGKAFHDGNKLK